MDKVLTPLRRELRSLHVYGMLGDQTRGQRSFVSTRILAMTNPALAHWAKASGYFWFTVTPDSLEYAHCPYVTIDDCYEWLNGRKSLSDNR